MKEDPRHAPLLRKSKREWSFLGQAENRVERLFQAREAMNFGYEKATTFVTFAITFFSKTELHINRGLRPDRATSDIFLLLRSIISPWARNIDASQDSQSAARLIQPDGLAQNNPSEASCCDTFEKNNER